jgi:hypothetical protein
MALRDGCGLQGAADETLIRCGAALTNIRLALRFHGYLERADLAPEGAQSKEVARITTLGTQEPSHEDRQLFCALESTDCAQWDLSAQISPAFIGLLRHAARREGAWLELIGGVTPGFQRWPLHAAIGTLGSDRVDWIRAGEALQRVALHASLHGLRVSVVPGGWTSRPSLSPSPVTPFPSRGEAKVVARFDRMRDWGAAARARSAIA